MSNQELSEESQRFLSIIFLAIAGLMSFHEYVHIRWFWDYHLSFKPGLNERGQITTAAIAAALMLSWLGIKEVAGACWILALGAGLYSAISNNLAMGFYGYLYIACGCLGLLFHSKLNPGQLVAGVRDAY